MMRWNSDLNVADNHRAAAKALLAKFAKEDVSKYGGDETNHHWGEFVSGELGDGRTVHVLLERGALVVSRESLSKLADIHAEIASGGCRGGIGMQKIAKSIESLVGKGEA